MLMETVSKVWSDEFFLGKYVLHNVKEGINLVCNGRTVVFMGEESLNHYLKESPMPAQVHILWLPMYYGNMIFRHNSPLRPGTKFPSLFLGLTPSVGGKKIINLVLYGRSKKTRKMQFS